MIYKGNLHVYSQCQMQDFLKGGPVTLSHVCIAHMKLLEATPTLIKTIPIFDHFREELLALPVNRSQNFC